MASKRRRRQSKPRAQQPEIVAEPVVEIAKPVVVYESETPFGDVEDYETGWADERQLRLLMKDWRKGRATRTIWDMLTDSYVALFSAIVIIAMVVSGIMSVQQSAAGCSTEGCVTARGLLPWMTLALVLLLGLSVSRIFGPVIASAAEGFWLLDAPIRRARLLSRRLWGVVVVGLFVGALLGGLIGMVTGLDLAAVGLWSAATGLATAAVVAFAAGEQTAERTGIMSVLAGIVGAVAIGVLGLMVALSAGWLTLRIDPAQTERLGWVVAGISALALIGALVRARMQLHNLRRARLVSGGDLLSGMQGAMFALDFGLMRDILVERRWLAKGHVTPVSGRASGRATLVWREVEKLQRNPRGVLVLLASALVPYALLSLGLGNLTPALSAIVLMFVMVPFFDSLRVVSRTRGLARAFPMSTSDLNGALTVIPFMLALIWAGAAAPAYAIVGQPTLDFGVLGAAVMKGLITGIAGYVGAIRWVSAKSADYSSPMVATGFGAMPPGLAFNLIRGFDVIALITLPLLVGWSPMISVVLAVIVYLVLRSGGFNAQEMIEKNQEAQRELEAMKAGQSGGRNREKITYTRKTR